MCEEEQSSRAGQAEAGKSEEGKRRVQNFPVQWWPIFTGEINARKELVGEHLFSFFVCLIILCLFFSPFDLI
jgi:hypothetical protein